MAPCHEFTDELVITPKLAEILCELKESGKECNKDNIARSCMLIAGYNNPDIMPLSQDFFILQKQFYDLLCCFD